LLGPHEKRNRGPITINEEGKFVQLDEHPIVETHDSQDGDTMGLFDVNHPLEL